MEVQNFAVEKALKPLGLLEIHCNSLVECHWRIAQRFRFWNLWFGHLYSPCDALYGVFSKHKREPFINTTALWVTKPRVWNGNYTTGGNITKSNTLCPVPGCRSDRVRDKNTLWPPHGCYEPRADGACRLCQNVPSPLLPLPPFRPRFCCSQSTDYQQFGDREILTGVPTVEAQALMSRRKLWSFDANGTLYRKRNHGELVVYWEAFDCWKRRTQENNRFSALT